MRPSIASQYQALVRAQLGAGPSATSPSLTKADIQALPEPVRRYVSQSGALGRPVPRNMRLEFDTTLRKKPGSSPIPGNSVQVSSFEPPTRAYHMRARMSGLPVSVLHSYAGAEASMQVKVAGLFYAVDLKSHELFMAECVTVLNEWCLFAPGRLHDPRLAWKAIDAKSAEVAFTNQGVTVKAVLHFGPSGDLVDFVSDDRLALQDDGSLKRSRFSTPMQDPQDFDGLRLSRKGDAIWHYPEGNFTYGSFVLKKAEYNVN